MLIDATGEAFEICRLARGEHPDVIRNRTRDSRLASRVYLVRPPSEADYSLRQREEGPSRGIARTFVGMRIPPSQQPPHSTSISAESRTRESSYGGRFALSGSPVRRKLLGSGNNVCGCGRSRAVGCTSVTATAAFALGALGEILLCVREGECGFALRIISITPTSTCGDSVRGWTSERE